MADLLDRIFEERMNQIEEWSRDGIIKEMLEDTSISVIDYPSDEEKEGETA